MAPKKPTKQMELGSILHAVLLEDKAVDDLVKVYPASCLKSDGSLNPKPSAQFRDDNPGVTCVKNADHIHACVHTVVRGLYREWYQIIQRDEVYREKILHWDDLLPCRAMVDCFYVADDAIYVYDVKCTETFPPDSFNRTARRLRYWLQQAHYSIGLTKLYDRPVIWRWVIIETIKPYRVQMRWYDSRSAEIATDYRNAKLKELLRRTNSNEWDDDYPQEMIINLWEVDTEESEVWDE
jgi:hypothetical protein